MGGACGRQRRGAAKLVEQIVRDYEGQLWQRMCALQTATEEMERLKKMHADAKVDLRTSDALLTALRIELATVRSEHAAELKRQEQLLESNFKDTKSRMQIENAELTVKWSAERQQLETARKELAAQVEAERTRSTEAEQRLHFEQKRVERHYDVYEFVKFDKGALV